MSQPGVGAKQDEEVGKAADGHAQVCADALLPRPMNINSIATDHARVMQRLGGAKARGINQHINRALCAILRDDAVLTDFADAISNKFNIGPLQRRIEIIGDQHTFAAELIVRCDAGAQFGVGYLRGNMVARHLLSALAERLHFSQKSPNTNFIQPEQRGAEEPGEKGKLAEAVLPAVRDGKVFLGDNPRRRALEY